MSNSYRVYFSLSREQMERFQLKYPDANLNTIAKQIFIETLDGKIQPQAAKTLENDLKEQKLKNMRKDGALKDLQIFQTFKTVNKPISLDELIEISTGKKEAQQLLFRGGNQPTTPSPTNETTNPQNNTPKENNTPIWIKALNRLICFECEPRYIFEYYEGFKNSMLQAIDEFTAHKLKVHNRGVNETERTQLVEFLNEVDKIAA